MERLEQFYTAVGGNAKEIVARLGGNAAIVERFLSRFPKDESMASLRAALSANDTQTAFRAAHTMKGVCANLGIESLYRESSAVTELLRAGRLEEAKAAFPSLEAEYGHTLAALAEIGIQ